MLFLHNLVMGTYGIKAVKIEWCFRTKLTIHKIKPTNALIFKSYFYTRSVVTATCSDLS